jgi:choline monooxygenase
MSTILAAAADALIDRADFANVNAGRGLPPEFYTSQEIYETESRRVFGRAWQYALHADRVATPGSWAQTKLGEHEVIVTRDRDGILYAFRNTCLHRGARIAPCDGKGRALRCPYHAWSYSLDGTLLAAPGFEGDARVAPGKLSLKPARIFQFGPLIFVSLDPEGEDIDTVLGPLSGVSEKWMGLKFRETRSYVYECNWKVAIENSVECYHCPTVHPSFAELIDTEQYLYELHSYCAITGGEKLDEGADAVAYDALKGSDNDNIRAYFVWPNLWILTYPGSSNLVVAQWLPLGKDKSVCNREFYFDDKTSDAEQLEFINYVERIQLEDVGICEDVFRNMRTGGFIQSILHLGPRGTSEAGIRHFQDLILRHLRRA